MLILILVLLVILLLFRKQLRGVMTFIPLFASILLASRLGLNPMVNVLLFGSLMFPLYKRFSALKNTIKHYNRPKRNNIIDVTESDKQANGNSAKNKNK